MATRKTKTTTEDQVTDAAVPAAGGATGMAAGAAVGAVAGGPVGAAVGAAIGGPVGAAIGSAATWDDAEEHFKSHYESGPYRQISSWQDVSPAYRYGFESAGGEKLRGRTYDEVSGSLRKGYSGKGKYDDVEPMIRTAYESRAGVLGTGSSSPAVKSTKATAGAREAVIPVVEEEIAVGKRKVEKGGVKVETTVTETPVAEDVSLHEEHVKVKRKPVDRAVTAADAAFREGTIEMKETAEEAVVAKRARVIEEIVISREGSDHTETVRDKVRKTDVDVKKTAGNAKVGAVQWEKASTNYQKHFGKHYAKSDSSYDEFTPAYRYGHNLAADERFQGSWKSVEPEARKHWEARNEGTWEEFKDAVHHAWGSVTGQKS